MKRAAPFAMLLLVLALALGGCGDDATGDAADSGSTGTTTSAITVVEGFDAMATDGANESAALSALPALAEAQKESGEWDDVDWEAVDAAEPRFVAYIVRVELADQVALFEVRADGIPHNLYGYQRAFDSGSIIWTAAADSQGATAVAASAGETLVTSAVETAMRDAFPEDPFTVLVAGYRFAYLLEGTDPLLFEVAPDGSLISASR
ncbi:MAG: hypothetical protein Q7W51_01735 [Coriobacteriia bacterium]|nr:hypothetical protein [Coriobacteriia bacterium]